MKRMVASCAVTFALVAPAMADEFSPAIESYYRTEIARWSDAQILIDAINAQNTRTSAYDQAQIDSLDQAWRAEVGQTVTPSIEPVLDNAASAFLRDQVLSSEGRITEVFIMDARGLNVAASEVTSDYWQGDEEKFSETYMVGPNAMHLSDVELDESTQRYQGQVSVTLTDPATGQPIGAITIGIDAEALM